MNSLYHIRVLLALFIILSTAASGQGEEKPRGTQPYGNEFPLRETRAVWLTTIKGLDWPRTLATDAASRKRQKAELVKMLDNYKQANINTVIFQTRVRASMLYPSKIEPWETGLTGKADTSPGYDPLAFCIEECHKRGMELHAWVVCIPIGDTKRQGAYGAASIAKRHRELVKTAKGGEMFMIPGKPQTADYIASICREIAENYDVDGISLDYIRYPESVYSFSDDELYPRSSSMSKADWKRENITRIVRRVHDAVKAVKPWVKLSSSPIGKYRDTKRYSAGGWNGYNAVFQDPVLWLSENVQDLLFPMMYFKENNFYPFLFQWAENAHGHPIVPGLGIYFLDPREGRWTLNDVRAEMHTARNSGIGGIAFYRGDFLTKNHKGIYDTTCKEFYPYPALTARMTWMGDTLPPATPTRLRYEDRKLRWAASPSRKEVLYNVYGSDVYPVDVTKAENLLDVNVRATDYELRGRALKVRHYAVTAIDRFGNESPAVQEPRPVLTLPKHINVPQLINRDLGKQAQAGKTGKANKKKKRK